MRGCLLFRLITKLMMPICYSLLLSSNGDCTLLPQCMGHRLGGVAIHRGRSVLRESGHEKLGQLLRSFGVVGCLSERGQAFSWVKKACRLQSRFQLAPRPEQCSTPEEVGTVLPFVARVAVLIYAGHAALTEVRVHPHMPRTELYCLPMTRIKDGGRRRGAQARLGTFVS